MENKKGITKIIFENKYSTGKIEEEIFERFSELIFPMELLEFLYGVINKNEGIKQSNRGAL